MATSAILVSYRTGPVLSACLAALIASPEITEIVLLDNGNPSDTVAKLDALASTPSKIRLIRGQGNIGFGAACNRGADAATGDTLLLVNPDVVLMPGAVPSLLSALKDARAPAIVGGDLRDPTGNPDRGTRREQLTLWRALVSFLGLSRFGLRDFHRHKEPVPEHAIEIGAVSGALMAMRRADYLALNGFDEGYFIHVEDLDICRRAHEAGGQVLFQPGPHGVHHRSTSDAPSKVVQMHKARSFGHYFRKFSHSPFERTAAAAVGWVLRMILPARGRD